MDRAGKPVCFYKNVKNAMLTAVDGWGSEIGSTLTFSTSAEVLPSVSVPNMRAVVPFHHKSQVKHFEQNRLCLADYRRSHQFCDIQEKGLTLVVVARLHANLQDLMISAYICVAHCKFFISIFFLGNHFNRQKQSIRHFICVSKLNYAWIFQ